EGLVGAEITYSYLAGGDFREDTSVAMINQFREAGLNVIADGRPSSDFWGNWINYPFSTTNWNGRPLGVQILNLAYRSGVDWNEAHYNNPDFDALLDQANGLADPDARREVMGKLQKMMQDDGVIIQPYWRGIFSHATDRVLGYQMHQAFEHHYETVSLA
ncbi:MAG: diguanylate cyclase, partial [Geminicoccus sp.]|nr:diguanylate cyclase [Geminicoccus sp.]